MLFKRSLATGILLNAGICETVFPLSILQCEKLVHEKSCERRVGDRSSIRPSAVGRLSPKTPKRMHTSSKYLFHITALCPILQPIQQNMGSTPAEGQED